MHEIYCLYVKETFILNVLNIEKNIEIFLEYFFQYLYMDVAKVLFFLIFFELYCFLFKLFGIFTHERSKCYKVTYVPAILT